MPRPTNTDRRRQQIVEGLARVMADRGYAKATVQAIAEAAGLTPGLVHYHFDSKQEILLALVEQLASVVRARLEADDRDPAHQLPALIDALVGTERGIEGAAVACWVVIGAEAVRQLEVRELYESLIRELTDAFTRAFRAAMHKEGRSDETASSAAVAVVASIEGFFRLAAAAPACVTPGSSAPTVKQIARGFIEAAPEAS